VAREEQERLAMNYHEGPTRDRHTDPFFVCQVCGVIKRDHSEADHEFVYAEGVIDTPEEWL
jgi:hypothetical protein